MTFEATELEIATAEAARARDASLAGTAMKKTRGVVHTPPAIARFVAARAHALLGEVLGRGLGDPGVCIVDPACGPGAFLAASLAVMPRGARPGAVHGLDVDASAIGIAERALARSFAARAVPLSLSASDALRDASLFDLVRAHEIAVVIGNPPWAGRTANEGSIEALLEDFRRDDAGERLAERKLGVLSDDYVRFFRLSAELVRTAGRGVIALVTNASYVDGPVHRGMRGALARWFDVIEVFELGGSALVARTSARDDNLFGVRPAAVITIAARVGEERGLAKVRHVRLVGSRDDKLARLGAPLSLEPVAIEHASRPFRPMRAQLEYEAFPALSDLVPFHREGVQTNRDDAVIAPDVPALIAKLEAFAAGRALPELVAARTTSRHYDVDRAREAVKSALERDPDGARGVSARRIAYRPFDVRAFAPIAGFCHRPRPELLAAFDHSTGALVTVRKDRGERIWSHLAFVDAVPDNCFLSARSSCRARAYPTHDAHGAPNLSARAKEWTEDGEAMLDYLACVLGAGAFIDRFDEVLRREEPRVPLPPSAEAFRLMANAGARLRRAFLEPAAHTPAETVVGHFLVADRGLIAARQAADSAFADGFPRLVR